tara:strand:+ start:6846 stop:7289 length:444 start_codon:yes stop_codon:yes gene_type:complete
VILPAQLIAYDRWANKKVLDVLAVTYENSECLKLMSHILQTQCVWAHRVLAKEPIIEIWPNYSLEECNTLFENNSALLSDIGAQLEEIIVYKNSKGAVFSNKVADILQHLIIHGQHHRAQIAFLLRQNEIEPPITDYIFFLRENSEN